ncbi:DUF2169 family type VI secretion system accessory protein [Saccharospirillum impatiens]|uniref:DUF2169 family type VI secretion system accessory protein n=1 Tax=Saccharospirillum impatiens TaxID=169438 RepID=UPI0004081198|nr:DUF2169 domain-containing protein [Saccharospirillum impatiens]
MIELVPHEEIATALLPGWTATGEAAEVLVAKVSFSFNADGELTPIVADPIVMADDYPNDDPENEAPAAGIEAVPFKQGAEWWLVGSAYSDEPRPFFPVQVRLTTSGGEHSQKHLVVYGKRHWQKTWRGWVASPPEPITQQPIGYEVSYGGRHPDIDTDTFVPNPVGLGYLGQRKRPSPEQQPLPHLEALDRLMARPIQRGERVGMGPIPSHWPPRADAFSNLDVDALMRGDCPYPDPLPATAYHSASADQWLKQPLSGDIMVELKGLVPGVSVGQIVTLPIKTPVLNAVLRTRTTRTVSDLQADTLIIDTQQSRVHLVYRQAFTDTHRRAQAELEVVALDAMAVPEGTQHG